MFRDVFDAEPQVSSKINPKYPISKQNRLKSIRRIKSIQVLLKKGK
jgi:hypothetical protein